jgi:methionyl-tRNA synthetase
MLEISVKCPHCGKSLMDENHKIDDCPGVRVVSEWDGKHGWTYLSALYGSYTTEWEFFPEEGTIIVFFCPHCSAKLTSTRECEECGASMVRLDVVRGGAVQVCSRRGCKHHLFEFENIETELRAFYNAYRFF